MKPYIWGIDLGGTTVKMGLFSSDGEKLDSWEIDTDRRDAGEHILPDIRDKMAAVFSERGLSWADVEGVGIGVPGSSGGDGVVSACVNLGWGRKDVRGELSALLDGIPVFVGNDANVAAFGESWRGAASGYADVVMVTLGTGVGGGIVLDGRIRIGAFGAGGEIGHIPTMEGEEECCGCGKKGCLEQYVSATGIARMARKFLAEDDAPSTLRGAEKVTAKTVFDEAKKGDALAARIAGHCCRILGRALAQIASVVDPQIFVIGGGVSKAGDYLLDLVKEHYRAYAYYACREAEIRLASLGNDAGMYGAARLVAEKD